MIPRILIIIPLVILGLVVTAQRLINIFFPNVISKRNNIIISAVTIAFIFVFLITVMIIGNR